MNIREYKKEDKERCIEIFDSNCPKFFDVSERDLFIKWLDHQIDRNHSYKSPTYTNSEKDSYYVIEVGNIGIIACGGFYIVKGENEARLAWGMIHSNFHKQGYGPALYNYRKNIIQKNWSNHVITLGTSQHTYLFYKKMGMNVIQTLEAGYGPDLDRYDMVIK